MFEIRYLPIFVRCFKKIPRDIRIAAARQEAILKTNPFDLRLNAHKLSGKLKKYWSFSVNYQYRIIFYFEGNKIIVFYLIGDHSIYREILK